MKLDDYPEPSKTAIGRIMGEEALVVLAEQGRAKVLNEVGARIWTLVDGSRSVRDIAAAICTEFDVDQEQAEADTLAFLEQLADQGAVTVGSSPAAS